jgi:Xaa-Pro dipeptidase
MGNHLDFTIAEYQSRLAKTQAEMAKRGLPVLLLHAPENITYLSGFRMLGFFMYHALIVPAQGEPILVVRDVEQPAADETCWVKGRSVYVDTEQPINAAARALRNLGFDGGPIATEYNTWFLTLERMSILTNLLPNAKFVEEPNIVRQLRLIKSLAEVEYLRKASRVVEAMVQGALDAIRVGASERDLAAAITVAQITSGGEPPLEAILMTGERTRQLHGTWSDRRLKEGDLVYFELNGVVGGYWSKLMRTAVSGKPTPEQVHTADVILDALTTGIGMMRPGAVAGEIDDALRGPVLRAGLRDSYYHRVGYTLGLIHAPSSGEYLREFMSGDTWTLEAGQVFHMLVIAAGIGFSETVLVTEQGTELLTRFDRRLIEC